jgi:hypothetical protein
LLRFPSFSCSCCRIRWRQITGIWATLSSRKPVQRDQLVCARCCRIIHYQRDCLFTMPPIINSHCLFYPMYDR